ncbi:MAG: hypothetical protein AB7O37_18075 [Vicinamibacteria bacterium]
MEEGTKALLRRLAEDSLRIGSANDLCDRGFPNDARELREEAQRAIAEAIATASADDRDRIEALFGANARWDEHTWHRLYDYARYLLEREPELPVERLRGRHTAFDSRVRDLGAAPDAAEARLLVRHPWPHASSLPIVLLARLRREGERLVRCDAPPVAWELDLDGNGLREEVRRSGPEPCDALIGGVLVHAELDPTTAHLGTAILLRSRDRGALERVTADLRAALEAEGWIELKEPV